MADFHDTMMGRKFFESTVPRIASSLENIAKELKRQNDLKEEERALDAPAPPTDVKDIAGEFMTGD